MNLKIVNPLEFDGWDDLVLLNPDYSFFHSQSWAKVMFESYHYKPLYFTLIDRQKLKALIPIMEIRSFLTGRRGVSLPFTDFCQPIINDDINLDDVLTQIVDFGKKLGWKYFEWRFGKKHLGKMTASKMYYEHALNLQDTEEDIYKNFRSNTKRNIQKAIRERVKVTILNSISSIDDFYRLNCMTRKLHGLPPQPWYFFKKIFEHIISQGNGFVILASYQNKVIAGAVYFHFGNYALYKYGASDRRYQTLRANNLVMWEAIKWYAGKGFKEFSFGRTETDNFGLLQFKRGWGAKEETVNYYKYDLTKDRYLGETKEIKSSYNFFKLMPSSLLKIIGFLLYRHVG